jgi:dipeptidyl aminopeptidase/acylaminoacyl peptidase
VPAGRGAAPSPPLAPEGPIIEETSGRKAAARTYQDLLRTDHDKALFEFHLTSQLARVSLEGRVSPLVDAELATDFEISPDGGWLLVTIVEKPFSKVVNLLRFAERTEARSLKGGTPVVVAKLAVADNLPSGADAVRTGRRTIRWRADEPATVWFVEAVDRGDPAHESGVRDILSLWRAPFDADPVPLAKLRRRFGGVTWGDGSLAVVTESWRKTRAVRILAVDPSQPHAEPREWFAYSSQDAYANPGDFVTRQNSAGRSVLRRSPDGSLFLTGAGATAEGDLPFLDKFDPATGKTTRLFRSGAEVLERPVSLLDDSGMRFVASRESVTVQPNYHVRDASGITQVTDFPHPYPQLAGVTKEFIRATRADGVGLTATLWLPAGWTPEQGPLPTVLWAYPREFVSADDAGQVTGSPNQFSRISPSRLTWLVLAGYAVLDEASMPVVGRDGNEPNDTFIEQIVLNASALIDEATRRGVTDPARVGVAGHSYGAFMTANLLAHSDLFKAGIARSGAYNRTLTPFGFQNEQRDFWEAPEVYGAMSPFHAANKLKYPILLVHGMADNNSGTFPIQTERLFSALRGLAKTARYVQLPLESHGYTSRESVLHVAWESQRWLDLHVRRGVGVSE